MLQRVRSNTGAVLYGQPVLCGRPLKLYLRSQLVNAAKSFGEPAWEDCLMQDLRRHRLPLSGHKHLLLLRFGATPAGVCLSLFRHLLHLLATKKTFLWPSAKSEKFLLFLVISKRLIRN